MCELLDAPPGAGALARRRRGRLRRACATRSPRHTVVLLDVDSRHGLAARRRRAARWRATASASTALHAERAPVYEALADAILADSSREAVRRAAPAVAALRERAAGHAAAVGAQRVGRLPRLRRRRRARRRGAAPGTGARFLVTDETRRRRCYGGRPGRGRGDADDPAGRGGQDAGSSAGAVLRGLAAAGMDHDDHVLALGGGVVGDLAGFCAAIYQRGMPVVQLPTTLVAQVDSAYGGKTGVDLPEGKNYAGAYHQPRRRARRPARARDAAARGARRGLGRGGQDGADRRRAAVGARPARRRAGRRATSCWPARARSSRSSRATSATPAAARSSTSATRSATRSRPRRATRATATARRSGSACSPRSRCPASRRCAPRSPRCSPRAGCRPSSTPRSTTTPCWPPCKRDKKRRGGRVGFVLVEAPGRRAHGRARRAPTTSRAALEELRPR